MRPFRIGGVLLMLVVGVHAFGQTNLPIDKVESGLVSKYGEGVRVRADRGLHQVASLWRSEDGDGSAFEDFANAYFAGDQPTLDQLFDRLQFVFESLDGHMQEIRRDWSRQTDLDIGNVYDFDQIMAGYDPASHIADDMFANKLAFVVLLNFPLTTLDERVRDGSKWTRRQWAEARLASKFEQRIPASAAAGEAQAYADGEQFVNSYNIWMHHLVDANGNRLFPPNMRLLEHWNLRDEIKADYADTKNGLAKQRAILKVMERIVDQSIPNEVVDNPQVDWNPNTNEVKPAAEKDSDHTTKASTEQAPRYIRILEFFKAEREIDKYCPETPTFIDRVFSENREMSEKDVRAMLEQVLTSPEMPKVGELIKKRLGRPLEPFDVWYSGFQPRSAFDETQLDAMTRKKFPNPEAYHAEMPNFFKKLGFAPDKAQFLAEHIVVDPARGSGHAQASSRRGDDPHLRTRIAKDGMDYKGYNIAIHEMGHNVLQVFSLYNMDYHTLIGVPNAAINEAMAFVFQSRDLYLLGALKNTNGGLSLSETDDALNTLSDFWNTCEIAGVALVEIDMWHWMYNHPDATPEQLRDALVQISKDTWNKYYAPVFGSKDSLLLGVYAHMVNNPLYLADYPIGRIVAFQVEQQMRKAGSVGPEFERMTTYGNVLPNLWMVHATGSPISADAIITAARKALTVIKS